jgi:hypothetical protein
MDVSGGSSGQDDSSEALLNDLRRSATNIGNRILTPVDYEEHGVYSPDTITQRFTEWHFALHKAGLIDEETMEDWEAERYDLIADVRRVAAGVEGDLTLSTYMNQGAFSHLTVKKHLGDGAWHKTLAAADLSGYGEERDDPEDPPTPDAGSTAGEGAVDARTVASTPPADGSVASSEAGDAGHDAQQTTLDSMPGVATRSLFQQVSDKQPDSACPTCGESYSSLGLHWAQAAECGYPSLTLTQKEALRGILLRHGTIEKAGDKARVRVRTDKPGLVLWLADLFGPLTSRVEVVEREVDGLDAEEGAHSRSAAFATINHPELLVVRQRWRDGPPLDYAATTTTTRLAVLYALAGWVDAAGYACLPMSGSGLSEQSIRRLFQGFDVRIRDQKDGPLVALGDRERFGQRIAAGAVPLPLAGTEEKFRALGLDGGPEGQDGTD